MCVPTMSNCHRDCQRKQLHLWLVGRGLFVPIEIWEDILGSTYAENILLTCLHDQQRNNKILTGSYCILMCVT